MTATDSYTDLVEAPECPSLREGQRVFERYVLEEMAGRGGMGVVWKARDRTLDRIVALKFLPDRLYRDAVARDELKGETRRCLELAHPHIVRVHDFLEDGDMAAIAMEYVDGANLSELRMERPSRCFKPEELSGWVTGLCAAMDYAHQVGRCLHRELQPGRLLVNSLGALKITDFGFVFDAPGHTEAGAGTDAALAYMSPQLVMGEPPAPSDDIYALGATVYELLTGKPPFFGDDLSSQIFEVIPESMAERRRNSGRPESALPAAWEETIAACLAKDPGGRPASGSEIASRLGLAVQASAEAASSVEGAVSILRWLKDPRLAGALSRGAGRVRVGVAQLKETRLNSAQWKMVQAKMAQWKAGAWQQHRRPMIISAAILCAPVIIGALVLPQVGKKHAPVVLPMVAAAPVSAAPVAASAPAPAVAPVPVVGPSVVVNGTTGTAGIAATPAAPVGAAVVPPSPAPAEAPVIPSVPPLTADQRALVEPVPTAEAGAQVRIETVPPGIPFQVMSDSPDAVTRAQAQGSGVSPATLILPKGAYRIVYSLPGQAPRMTSVKVPAAGSALFQQEFPHGVVKVHCQPERAEVICDGRSVGAAPVDLLLPPGRHEIGARWNGRTARTRTVELADAGEQTLAFEFPASSSSSTASRSHRPKKKQDDSLFAKIGRSFKNLFDGDSDRKR